MTRKVTDDAANTDKASPTPSDKLMVIDVATEPDSLKESTIQQVFDAINGLTAKTSLVDADQVAITDSAASNAAKKITWANVKAALDALYLAFVTPGTSGNVLTSNGSAWTSAAAAAGGGGSNSICDGRLSLESGVAISTSDQTAKTTVYFVTYKGNKIALYDGASSWDVVDIGTPSVAVPSTTSTPFDVFIYNNSGTPTLETVDWTNDTTRATALTTQDGVLVKTGATTRRYLGTGRTTSVSGQCEDSETKRFLWNYYNRVTRHLFKNVSSTHTYNSGTERAWNNDTTNKVEFVIGQNITVTAGVAGVVKAGADGSNAYMGGSVDGFTLSTEIGYFLNLNIQYASGAAVGFINPGVGLHYVGVIEAGHTNAASFTQYQIKCSLLG